MKLDPTEHPELAIADGVAALSAQVQSQQRRADFAERTLRKIEGELTGPDPLLATSNATKWLREWRKATG